MSVLVRNILDHYSGSLILEVKNVVEIKFKTILHIVVFVIAIVTRLEVLFLKRIIRNLK